MHISWVVILAMVTHCYGLTPTLNGQNVTGVKQTTQEQLPHALGGLVVKVMMLVC